MSTVDLIAIELRKAIFSGALPVGAPLGEVEIATQLGVSRSPFREGAQRLVQEGLLIAVPGRGMSVAVLEGEQVDDVYQARLAIETQAARQVALHGDAAVLNRLEAQLRELIVASEGDDARAIGDADLEFHQMLVDAAGSERLTRFMATLVMQTRIASFSAPDGYSVRRSVSPTYRMLLDALRAGDDAAAASALATQFDEAVARLRGRGPSVDLVEPEDDGEPIAFEPISPVGGE
ncbi:GntR family transcriptional regulator [Microbacterium sp. NPDC058345]|uniref:GntR family transcriptional regulator n=1 Tax=Microbacterium sp. NPDC058345 TaxID=3346455 RepID=UPI0036604602